MLRAGEVGAGEVGAREHGLEGARPGEPRPFQLGIAQDHQIEVGAGEIGALEVRLLEHAAAQIGALEVEAGEVQAREVEIGELGPAVAGRLDLVRDLRSGPVGRKRRLWGGRDQPEQSEHEPAQEGLGHGATPLLVSGRTLGDLGAGWKDSLGRLGIRRHIGGTGRV